MISSILLAALSAPSYSSKRSIMTLSNIGDDKNHNDNAVALNWVSLLGACSASFVFLCTHVLSQFDWQHAPVWAVLDTVAEIGLRIEHTAHNEGANVSASRFHWLPTLQYDNWQASLGQLQCCKQACRPTAYRTTVPLQSTAKWHTEAWIMVGWGRLTLSVKFKQAIQMICRPWRHHIMCR